MASDMLEQLLDEQKAATAEFDRLFAAGEHDAADAVLVGIRARSKQLADMVDRPQQQHD